MTTQSVLIATAVVATLTACVERAPPSVVMPGLPRLVGYASLTSAACSRDGMVYVAAYDEVVAWRIGDDKPAGVMRIDTEDTTVQKLVAHRGGEVDAVASSGSVIRMRFRDGTIEREHWPVFAKNFASITLARQQPELLVTAFEIGPPIPAGAIVREDPYDPETPLSPTVFQFRAGDGHWHQLAPARFVPYHVRILEHPTRFIADAYSIPWVFEARPVEGGRWVPVAARPFNAEWLVNLDDRACYLDRTRMSCEPFTTITAPPLDLSDATYVDVVGDSFVIERNVAGGWQEKDYSVLVVRRGEREISFRSSLLKFVGPCGDGVVILSGDTVIVVGPDLEAWGPMTVEARPQAYR